MRRRFPTGEWAENDVALGIVKSSAKTSLPVEFKGFELPALRAVLRDPSPAAIRAHLEGLFAEQPAFFEWQPVVFDVSRLSEPVDETLWAQWIAAFQAAHLHPVAVAGAPESFFEMASALRLGVVDLSASAAQASAAGAAAGRTAPASVPESSVAQAGPVSGSDAQARSPQPAADGAGAPAAVVADAVPAAPLEALLIDRPVRSGQQIYARDRDLVITAVVSPGAEVVADGNVHVYGTLAGRAIAGARGNREARIFTLDLRAELVAIAGLYKTFEDGVPEALRGKLVQILLGESGTALEIRPL